MGWAPVAGSFAWITVLPIDCGDGGDGSYCVVAWIYSHSWAVPSHFSFHSFFLAMPVSLKFNRNLIVDTRVTYSAASFPPTFLHSSYFFQTIRGMLIGGWDFDRTRDWLRFSETARNKWWIETSEGTFDRRRAVFIHALISMKQHQQQQQ